MVNLAQNRRHYSRPKRDSRSYAGTDQAIVYYGALAGVAPALVLHTLLLQNNAYVVMQGLGSR
jgi:hypothetical protein